MTTTAADEARADTPRRTRLHGVDVARALAVLGMVAAHVLPLSSADGARTTSDLIVSGRSAATFAVLAGVGVALAARGRPRTSSAVSIAVRGLLIGVVGLALGGLDSGVLVILGFYGLFFLLLAPAIGLRARPAVLAAGAVALLGPPLSQLLRIDRSGTAFNPSLSDAAAPGALLDQLLLTGTYPALPWVAYLLLGLGIGQLPLRRMRTALAVLIAGVALSLAAHAGSALLLGPLGGYDALAQTTTVTEVLADEPDQPVQDIVDASRLGTVPTDSAWWLASDARHSSTPLDLVATAGIALAVLGASLLLVRPARLLMAPLAAVGSMPLSIYTGHVCFLAATDLPDPETSYVLQILVAMLAATLWRHYVGRGPLEALLALTTRQVQART